MNDNFDLSQEPEDLIVAVVREQDTIKWYRSERDLWILDINKWREDIIQAGFDFPPIDKEFRNGIDIVNENTKSQFLDFMSQYEIKKDTLSLALLNRMIKPSTWWDIYDLFPIIFVDFDNQKIAVCYLDGIPLENYIPHGWKNEFIDFCNEYSEAEFPTKDKFWVKGDSDLLKLYTK